MFIAIIWIGLAIVIGNAGKARKLGGTSAFFCALFFSPLIGLIAVLASDKLTDSHPIAQPLSVADELAKLKHLYDTDVLTRTEYDAQKARLLGLPSPASQSAAASGSA